MPVISRFGTFALFLFIAVILSSPFLLMGMDHHSHGAEDKASCHFMLGGTKACAMDLFDHIVLLQVMFALPPAQFFFTLAYLILLLLTVLLLQFMLTLGKLSRKRRRLDSKASTLYVLAFTSHLLGSAISPRAP